ncbi:Pentatricopeptide repeat-containing protein [Acorus calamus]|uniref:Pentatricopeptide repeat-containing protein n=1 Tax=Acorus calamus TaxID=4465 RepID=A0AAV9CB81_ACOCL|nr:Pentatricopeptide repeat-containing protein [Acorus calamus]
MGSNVFVATSLVDMYAKCGSTGKAREVFDRMVVKDVVSWSAMIGGYSLNGQPKEALELFHLMCSENVRPDEFTVVAVLSACAKLGALDLGDGVRHMKGRDRILWNAMICGLALNGHSKPAFGLFGEMEKSGFSPDGNTERLELQELQSIIMPLLGKSVINRLDIMLVNLPPIRGKSS